jgi:uncharacterized protein YidB (DUF937 family)
MSLFEQLRKQAGIILGAQAGVGAEAGPGSEAEAGSQPVAPDALMGGILEMLGQRGLGPLLQGLKDKGLGDAVASWVGTGENQPVAPGQLEQGLGREAIEKLAARLGIPPGQASALLARYLPQIIDRLTPHGKVEDEPVAPAPGP